MPADTVKVELQWVDQDGNTQPFWIKLVRELSTGAARKVTTAGWTGMRAGPKDEPEIAIDWQRQSFARTEAYLKDWSLTDDDSKKLPITRESIEWLRQDVYAVIEAAITAHVEAMADQKKVPSSTAEPEPTSA